MDGNPGEANATAIEAHHLCKSYKLFRSRKERILDALGLHWAMPGIGEPPQFVALSDINIRVAAGERVGVIGRNGAGKSTLLKIISGIIAPTSGSLEISGSVQALMQIGLGFHPDFTGRENIRASILYNGLPPDMRRQAETEITDFVELGAFLDQPLRTYSMGMRSRLQFACATAINPDILIIDEVLAVGDVNFIEKCKARIRQLTSNSCTMLLVSHSMPQITDFCDRAIWIEAGTVRMDGDAESVAAAYQSFMAELSSGGTARTGAA